MPQAFGRWFAQMYFQGISNIAIPDGAGDGKIDVLVTCQAGKTTKYKILNTKFTGDYDRSSPVSFYDEITRYWQAFENRTNRTEYLKVVREGLRPHIKKLFKLYDDGLGELYFVTNHRVNNAQLDSVKGYGMSILHLDELLQYVAEHIEGAMPETDPLLLTGISNVLTPATNESEVPTSIVFARLIDFINYMEEDPFDLLFARNVRLWLGGTETNKAILSTFRTAPKEFAYSNNGITILCKRHTHDVGKQELRLENPRIVNGSQTLHSIRDVDNPWAVARVMVRIIEVPAGGTTDLPAQVEKRKDIIHKISIRSNLQNPIRRWNLVSNDDFQNELARYFWDKHLYYERRQGEWGQRKFQLTSVGIRRGPDLRWLTQLIAADHYDRKKLGPAQAQGKLNELFEEEPYSVIRNTTPEKATRRTSSSDPSTPHTNSSPTSTPRAWPVSPARAHPLSATATFCRTYAAHSIPGITVDTSAAERQNRSASSSVRTSSSSSSDKRVPRSASARRPPGKVALPPVAPGPLDSLLLHL
jgi:AIPR protein